jgi:serine/threonine protein phosphatase PrpC
MVNQDTIRDNFSSITLLIDSIFDGTGGPGGAFTNLLVSSKYSNQIATQMLRKGTKNYGKTQEMLNGSTQAALG